MPEPEGVTDATEAPEQSQDTPEAPSAEDTAQAAVDFEKRYNDLRPEFDRTRQQLTQYEQAVAALQDPDTRDQALAYLGIEDDEAPDDDEQFEDDPTGALTRKVEALEARLAEEDQEIEQEQLMEAELDHINSELEGVQKDVGHELSEAEIQTIGDLSQAIRDERGRPDVRAAYERIFNQILPEQKKRWVETKRAGTPGSGGAAVENPDLDNEQERVQYMAQRLKDQELSE